MINQLTISGTLKVGAAVTSIGVLAFATTQITEIDLSDAIALETIGDSAFSNNCQLTGTLKVGPAVTSIGASAFEFYFDACGLIFTSKAKGGLTGLDISEATALETIGDRAFNNNAQLAGTLKVGPAVTSIGTEAFRDTGLTGIDLSEATALQTIGDSAFYDTELTGTLKVGPAVTSIGPYAFHSTRLTELDLSEATALETIGFRAFTGTHLAGQTVLKADGTSIRLT